MPLSIMLRGSILWDNLTESNSVSTSDSTGQDANFCVRKAVVRRCEFDLLFYNSQSQANWSRKNGQALPAVCGEISNTEI
jgi:hypothetical protein